jgi:TPR repeat protein
MEQRGIFQTMARGQYAKKTPPSSPQPLPRYALALSWSSLYTWIPFVTWSSIKSVPAPTSRASNASHDDDDDQQYLSNLSPAQVEALLETAKQGDADAQYQIGTLSMMGRFGPPDLDVVLDWWTKAALQGHLECQYLLGTWAHIGGALGAPDYEAARDWFTRAADQGDPRSQTSLGNLYFEGRFGTADPHKALELFTKAALTRP